MLVTILLAVLMFGLLIFVHELGHFLAAKWAGIRVTEFALGMGPAIFSFTRGETRYALRLFPIGGFLAMDGEHEESSDRRAFCNAPVYKRMIVMAAGVFMNMLLGLILAGIVSSQAKLLGTTQVNYFADDAVSSQQLKAGDVITRANGSRVRTSNDLITQLLRERDGVMEMTVLRGESKEELTLLVPFRMDKIEGEDSIEMIYLDFTLVGVPPTPSGIVLNTFDLTASYAKQIWGSLADLFTGRFGIKQFSGPVGVTKAIGEASKSGVVPFLSFTAFMTVNLGVFNLLPIPALDGGRLLFLIVEIIRRKPINPKYEGYVTAAGFVLLIGLMITVTVNDVFKLF